MPSTTITTRWRLPCILLLASLVHLAQANNAGFSGFKYKWAWEKTPISNGLHHHEPKDLIVYFSVEKDLNAHTAKLGNEKKALKFANLDGIPERCQDRELYIEDSKGIMWSAPGLHVPDKALLPRDGCKEHLIDHTTKPVRYEYRCYLVLPDKTAEERR